MTVFTKMTNEQVRNFGRSEASTHQRNVQGQEMIPVIVDLSVVGALANTLGKALLIALDNDAALAAAFGITIAQSGEMLLTDQKYFLSNIEYTAIIPNVAVDVLSYLQSGTHKEVAPAGLIYYRPSACVWRQYMQGVGASSVVVHVGFSR